MTDCDVSSVVDFWCAGGAYRSARATYVPRVEFRRSIEMFIPTDKCRWPQSFVNSCRRCCPWLTLLSQHTL